MLNAAFSKKLDLESKNYILPQEIISRLVISLNQSFDTGPELRLQKIYGDELWLKIKSLGMENFNWKDKDVLDIASGTGLLSYHLLSRVQPRSLTLIDISKTEIDEAKRILGKFSVNLPLKFAVGDATKTDFADNSFDVIIGNSFLHHFYDLPAAIKEFKRILNPGGLFITLHEPTVASLALESRNPKNTILYILKGDDYINYFRYKKDGVAPGQGGDVWMFKPSEIFNLLTTAGFVNIKLANWHCLRPKLVASLSMHLGGKKKKLNLFENFLLTSAVYVDSFLRKILSDNFFGSVAFVAQKPSAKT